MRIHTHQAGWSRNRYEEIYNGEMSLVSEDSKRTYKVKDGSIVQERVIQGENSKTQLIYGKFRKVWKKGKLTLHHQFWHDTSLHGKAFDRTVLLDFPGNLRQVYYHGSLMREKFIYSTGVTAYDIKRRSKELEFKMRYPTGAPCCKVRVDKAPIFDWAWSHHIITRNFGEHLGESWGTPIKAEKYDVEWLDEKGGVTFKGRIENRQRVHKWIEQGKEVWYLQGVAVSHKIYSTPAEELDIMDILGIENTQLRSAMLSKFPTQTMFDKIRAKGVDVKEFVDEANKMRLFSIPLAVEPNPESHLGVIRDVVLKFLEVTCPSTNAHYLLKVPPQATTCEEARQWTFGKDFHRSGVGSTALNIIPKEEYVMFEQET